MSQPKRSTWRGSLRSHALRAWASTKITSNKAKPYTSAMTAWDQKVRENANAKAAAKAATGRTPRPQSTAAKVPQQAAANRADAALTAMAGLPHGSASASKRLPRQNRGYPVGCAVPNP